MASRSLLSHLAIFFLSLLLSSIPVFGSISVVRIGGVQFPIQPSANVDQNCMFTCAQKENYSNVCYWNCGIDPLCQWGSMMQCVDAHPDRQMGCVNKSGCLNFVKTFIKDKRSQQNGQHTQDINQELLTFEVIFTQPHSPASRMRLFLLFSSLLLVTLLCLLYLYKRKNEKRSHPTQDCEVLIPQDVTARTYAQLL